MSESDSQENKSIDEQLADAWEVINAVYLEDLMARKHWVKETPPESDADRYSGGTLENWYIVDFPKSEDESSSMCYGNLYGDDRFNEGSFIHTSYIVSIDKENSTLSTRNTVYKLGKPRDVDLNSPNVAW